MLTNTTGLIIPAYFAPIGGEQQYWQRLIDAAKELGDRLIVIANPNDGPDETNDFVVNAYKEAIKQIQTHGAKVIGYVHTEYGNRDANLVDKEVNDWYNNYEYDKGDSTKGYISGIFFDEVSSNYGGPQGYYQSRYNEVKTAHQAKYLENSLPTVVNNFGTIPEEGFLEISNTILGIFERPDGFLDWESSVDWINPDNASRLLVLPYNIAAYSWQKWVDVVDHADSQSIGWIYVTDDTIENPWDRLPPYFELMVQYIKTAGEFSEFNKFSLSGNVGIGTTSPNEQLVVMNQTVLGENISSPGSEPLTVTGSGAGISFQDRGGITDRFVIYNIDGALRVWENSDRVAITQNTGNVGIGTSRPQKKLHIFTVPSD